MRINQPFSSIEQVADQIRQQNPSSAQKAQTTRSFAEVFESKLKFSKHAGERLTDRKIQLTDEQLQRLEAGTRKADEKGIQESLVLVDDMAFIVNVKNNTVITAMEQNENKDNIFTNIDGAVIM